MGKIFKCRDDKLARLRQFEARYWRRNEKFVNYFHDKVLLGNRLGLTDEDMLCYLIHGFENTLLQTQAKMKEFTNYNTYAGCYGRDNK